MLQPQKGGAGSAGPRPRAAVERLEGRLLLSTYFVSTAGSDFSAGSLIAPFRTIQRAASLAQPGDTVLIRGGVYRETVAPAHSGTQNAPITFAAYNGENVIVSGADPVSTWSNYNGSIYDAPIISSLGPGADQIFVDGQMMTEARWPNTGQDVSRPTLAHVQAAWGPNGTATIYDPALTQPDGYWNGAYIHIAPGQQWVWQTARVLSYVPGRLTFSYADMGNLQRPVAGDPYYLFGKFQALDAPGEWYVDPTVNKLYLWTPRSDSPANHLIEMKRREYAFDLRGVSDIHLDGINVFAATLATDTGSARTVIDHMHALYVSQFVLQASGWDQPTDAGIALNGPGSLLADSTIGYSAGDGVYVSGAWSRVTNCVVHDADYNGGDSAAIRIAGPYVQVDHNTVYNTARDGIRQGGWSASVLNNTIHHAMLQTTDGGGIYTVRSNGAGSRIAYNRVYRIHSGGYGAVGIYLDDDSSNYTVDHNLVWDVDHGMKLNNSSIGQQIYNNTLDASVFSIASNQAGPWTGSVLANNILFAPVQLGQNVNVQANIFAGANAGVVNRWSADYELAAGSPAIDAGVRIGAGTGDASPGPDIGALRYGLPPFASGSSLGEGADSQLAAAYLATAGATPPAPSKPPPPVPPAVASAPAPPAASGSPKPVRRHAKHSARQPQPHRLLVHLSRNHATRPTHSRKGPTASSRAPV